MRPDSAVSSEHNNYTGLDWILRLRENFHLGCHEPNVLFFYRLATEEAEVLQAAVCL